MSGPASGTTQPAVWAAFGGMIAMAASMGIGRFVYTPILPYMTGPLGLSSGDAGLIAAANYLGYFLGAVAGATGFLQGDRRRWTLWALALSAATTAAMAATASVPLFLVLRFVGGVCSAFVMVFGSALVFDRLAAARKPDLSHVHFAGVGVGIAVSAVLVAGLGGLGIGWGGQWLASGAISGGALVIALFLLPPGTAGSAPPAGTTEKRLDRRMLPLIASYGLFGFGYVITATFVSAMVRATPAIASIEPVVWLAVGVTAIPSVALWAWIGRRLGNPASIAIACLLEAAGVAATVLIEDPTAVLIGAGLLGGTFMGITAVGLATARDIAIGAGVSDPRRSIGLLAGSFALGQMIGPVFAGYAADASDGFTLPSLVAAAALVVAAACAAMVGRPAATPAA